MQVHKSLGSFFSLSIVIVSTLLIANCGSQMNPTSQTGNTRVLFLLTSIGNDQLTGFVTNLSGIFLTNKSGAATPIFAPPGAQGIPIEWMHLNGAVEPILAVDVPDDTYTSASVAVTSCTFTTVTFPQNTLALTTAVWAEQTCSQGTGTTTVNFPNPIVVSGSVMALSLNLQVSQSYTLNLAANPVTFTISPVFTLAPLSLAAQPTNDTNGKITGTDAQVTEVSADGNVFTVLTTDGFGATISSGASTVFQGISDFSSITTGLIVNLDAAIQPDGSLLATRIEANNATASAAVQGPFTATVNGGFITYGLQHEGCANNNPLCGGGYTFTGATAFKVSGQFSNVASLPFPAVFSGSSLVAGQNISVFPNGTFQGQVQDTSTIALEPQTINGTVSAVTNQNGFAVYTVTLATYDLFPVTESAIFNPPIANPTTVVVYVDTTAQMLNSGNISVGSLLRFRGVVFDDNGALRMDAGQIYDGVAE
jgi:hypothetical protein